MENWIPFEEGEYIIEMAFLFGDGAAAVLLENPYIEIFQDRRGLRQMNGYCRLRNILLVELLDDNDQVDMALDFGGEFKYILSEPMLKGGKVFSPDIKSSLQFSPKTPWRKISQEEFQALRSRLTFMAS